MLSTSSYCIISSNNFSEHSKLCRNLINFKVATIRIKVNQNRSIDKLKLINIFSNTVFINITRNTKIDFSAFTNNINNIRHTAIAGNTILEVFTCLPIRNNSIPDQPVKTSNRINLHNRINSHFTRI